MGLSAISARTFFRHQRKWLFPAVLTYWQNYKEKFLNQLKGVDMATSIAPKTGATFGKVRPEPMADCACREGPSGLLNWKHAGRQGQLLGALDFPAIFPPSSNTEADPLEDVLEA